MNIDSPHSAPSNPGAESTEPGKNPDSTEPASAAFHDAAKRIAEVKEYVRYYIAVQMDAAKLAVRSTVVCAILGIIGLLATGSAVVMAVVLLLWGIAQGIGTALGNRFWLGDLIVGVGVLGALALAAKIAGSMLIGSSRRKTVKKYESLQRQQRTRFGHDVGQHAGDV